MKILDASVELVILTLVLCSVGGVRAAELSPYKSKGQVVERLALFDNPEGAIFSADGRYVFISNSAELGMPAKGFRWVHGGGYISKLEVQANGTLKMVEERLITGLTGPLGMAVSTVATRQFPRGTIFVVEAWSQLAEADGTEVKDARILDSKILAFNASGKVLGSIRIGAGSPAAKKSGVPGVMGNAVAFDSAGDLYVADTGAALKQYAPTVPTHGGDLYMFPLSSLDALAQGRDAPLFHVTVPEGGPDGIEVAPDGMIHFNTVGVAAGLQDPAEGGMYKLSKADFMAGMLPQPFNRGLGALDGLTFAGGNRLDTEIKTGNSILVTPLAGGDSQKLTYDKEVQFDGPADIAVRKLDDGTYLLVVPELSGTSPNQKRNVVDVIRLPADF